ncbi:hypothetical protein L1080_037195 [Rhodococcus sp. MSC1_016]|uniref:hypothetical protein n=1 Tax=Rhodococcus sp. MSC1_016 TaxID=2909266 RepID=UPI00202FE5CD|nr:hypothetical protein [Rhodococcus sp. MSC1_016]
MSAHPAHWLAAGPPKEASTAAELMPASAYNSGETMTRLMRNTVLIQLAIAAIFSVLVSLIWDGLYGIDSTISPGPPWLAGLIAGGVVLAGVVITTLMLHNGGGLHDEQPGDLWQDGPDLRRLAATVVEDDTRDRPSRT